MNDIARDSGGSSLNDFISVLLGSRCKRSSDRALPPLLSH